MKKRVAVIAAAALIIGLLVWRFWPHSLSSVICVEKSVVTNIACSASIGGVENGKPYINSYTLSELSPQDDGFEEIMEILDSSNYRQDFRNLLPWSIDNIGSDGAKELLAADVVFVWGSGENESCFMSMHGESMIAVSSGTESGLKVYHSTNREMLDTLAEYLKTHGNKA
ncbi:MAG TPA: hypothetical protein DD735_01140 [Clostridiales bacterium]|nr:hypothetical protein [Clostridiales bacterium]HCG34721.1 hypothetical protein [Clostridiales bacterium]